MDNSIENYDYYSSGTDYTVISDSLGSSSVSLTDVVSTAALGVMILVFFVVIVFIYVFYSIFLAKIFKKAGVPAWQAWVPVLNNWRTYELGDNKGYWALIAFIPAVNIVSTVFLIISIHHINLKLRYGMGMTVLYLFMPLIWVIIAGLSKEPWPIAGPASVDGNAYQPPVMNAPASPQYGPAPTADAPQYPATESVDGDNSGSDENTNNQQPPAPYNN